VPAFDLDEALAAYAPEMDGLRTRRATQDDLPFLAEMATLFGGGDPDSPAVRDWMLPDWDLGFIAEEEGNAAGAGWWRPYTGFTVGGWDPAERELFLSVAAPYEGRGLGSLLLDALVAEARRTTTIRWLAARPRHDIGVAMLEKRGFERKDPPYAQVDPVWALELRAA
jgi:GNAT superfamily N-acetyltransferase